MKKTAITLVTTVVFGAGLMACSAESSGIEKQPQSGAQTDTIDSGSSGPAVTQPQSKTSYHNDTATVTFDHDQTCIKVDSGVPANISLTDGTTVVLRDVWLNSIVIPDAGAHKANMDDGEKALISQAFFALPISYDAKGCAKSLTAGIYPTERSMAARAMTPEGAYSPFIPMFGPSYGFANVSTSDLNKFFKDKASHNAVGNLTVHSLKDVGERPSQFRSRWTEKQITTQSTIRVVYVPYEGLDMGQICVNGQSQCAFYDVMREYTGPKNFTTKVQFYVPLTSSITVEFGQPVDNDADSLREALTLELAKTVESAMSAIRNLNITE